MFLSQILQRRPCPCKLSSGYVPRHCSLLQDNGVSLTSHNAERNSVGGCSTRRVFTLSRFTVVGIAPVLLTRSSLTFLIMFKSDVIYGVCIQIWRGGPCPMGWSTIVQQLHSSVNAIPQISRAFCVVVAVIICSCTLF